MRNTSVGSPKAKSPIGSLALTAFLLVLPFLESNSSISLYTDIIGRLHPLIVHFPIVLVIVSALIEWFWGGLRGPIGILILRMSHKWAMYTSLFATLCGYLLYSGGDYGGSTVIYHLWGGIVVTILLMWSLVFQQHYEKTHRWRWRQLYRSFLFGATAVVMYTGHLGGSLTHGSQYLTAPISKVMQKRTYDATTAMTNAHSLLIWQDILIPAFEKKCLQCHNTENAKSDLNLSSYQTMLGGGKSLKPMILPGHPDSSELYVRISLPPKHDEYMPPDGKAPLHPTEVQLLRSWIEAGANKADTLGIFMMGDSLSQLIDAYLPTLANRQVAAEAMRRERLKTGPKLIRIGHELGLEIRPDEKDDSARYTISMQFPPKVITDQSLAKLMDYKDYFTKVSLVASDITDDGLYYLGQMSNLREVILTKSCIKGIGLVHLEKLQKLELLNLSHTDVNDEQILHITRMPGLREVYLFNTYVTKELLETLDIHLARTKVSVSEGDYY